VPQVAARQVLGGGDLTLGHQSQQGPVLAGRAPSAFCATSGGRPNSRVCERNDDTISTIRVVQASASMPRKSRSAAR